SGEGVRRLARGAASILGRDRVGGETVRFNKYLELLIKWNSKHRIIGSTDPTWLADHLLLDSLVFLHVIPPTVKCLVDIGSGAGLPGLPIKIVRPDIRMLLVESRQRRASFLKTAVRELELVDVEILSERVLSVPSRWRKARSEE